MCNQTRANSLLNDKLVVVDELSMIVKVPVHFDPSRYGISNLNQSLSYQSHFTLASYFFVQLIRCKY
jgi:hypothetical protein